LSIQDLPSQARNEEAESEKKNLKHLIRVNNGIFFAFLLSFACYFKQKCAAYREKNGVFLTKSENPLISSI
jgi:hypothetical protein